jgi:xanthine dehydrogenase accessory factor
MDLIEQIAALRRDRQPFALATVVGRRAPVSSHLGDRAIVHADGRMEGFIGGACSRDIVRQQGLEALRTRQARLVSIRPDAGEAHADSEHVVVPMTCVSEGAIDVFVEPFVQARRLIVAGATPVGSALARLARAMDYEVVRAVDADERRDLDDEHGIVITLDLLAAIVADGRDRGVEQAAVVVTQGHYDEEALEIVLRGEVEYVGLVASRKRAETVRGVLRGSQTPGVDRIRNPAGLDLGAKTPPEVALSILAEIVQFGQMRTEHAVEPQRPPVDRPAEEAIDPVCGMTVRIAGAKHTAEVGGVAYYFCCGGCRKRFLDDPRSFGAGA